MVHNQVRVIITDKLPAYPDGIEQAFGSEAPRHIPSKPFIDINSTNLIERYQGTLKDRTEIMRGFKAGLSFPYKDWEDVVKGSGKDLSWRREPNIPTDKVLPFTAIKPTTKLRPKKRKPRNRERISRTGQPIGLSTIRR